MGNDHSTRMGATMPVWHIAGETPEEGEWPARLSKALGWDAENTTSVWVDPQGLLANPEEWPRRDAVPFVREPKVTPEMIAAARSTHTESAYLNDPTIAAIFRAMHVAAPVALVSDAERALTRERDEARAETAKAAADIDMLYTSWTASVNENEALRAGLAEVQRMRAVENDFAVANIANLRAQVMAACDKLAKLTVQPIVPDPPQPDFTRDFSGDRRRMGLA